MGPSCLIGRRSLVRVDGIGKSPMSHCISTVNPWAFADYPVKKIGTMEPPEVIPTSPNIQSLKWTSIITSKPTFRN